MSRVVAILALTTAFACGGPDSPSDPDGGSPDASIYPLPDDDVVPAVGSDSTLEIASWNIENFPRQAATPKMVSDLIASMDLDIVAVQEIENNEAWEELIARLPDHDGVLSSHTYGNGTFQKIGFIFRRGLVDIVGGTRLFDDDNYAFPRPPLQVVATVTTDTGVIDLVLITLHLKAGRDFEDRERREAALISLETHARENAESIDTDVVILGDFNEVVTSSGGLAVFDPFLATPARYTIETQPLAQSGAFSFVPSGSVLDHVLTSASLADERASGSMVIPQLHTQYAPYSGNVSDHLPVVLTLPLP